MLRSHSQINLLLVGMLTTGLSLSALAQSTPFPKYKVGENQHATEGPGYPSTLPAPWVTSNGQIITPAGTQVYLGTTTRAKAIALNPTGNHTAAVLQMGAPQAVTIFNTKTGKVLQTFSTPYLSGTATDYDSDGSTTGIAYTPDGLHLLFSQDGNYGPGSYVTIADVDSTTGLITSTGGTDPYPVQVNVPMDATSTYALTNVTCYPYNPAKMPPAGSPPGTTGSVEIPCGQTYSYWSDGVATSYPMGIATSPDGKTVYAVLDVNDTLTKIDLTAATPKEGTEVRVGNVPHSVIISPDGKTAYVSNEAGPIPTESEFQEYSDGTPVAAKYPTGSTAAGTLSIVDLAAFKVVGSIDTGLHPTGMAFYGKYLLVANAYSDSITVIDSSVNKPVRTIDLGLPIGIPGVSGSAYGAGPNSISVDAKDNIAYVALYNANAIAVVNLSTVASNPVLGMIPVGYAPSSVVLDAADNALLVANDKGLGATGYGVAAPPTATSENSYGQYYGVSDFNTHQDLGTASIVPIPTSKQLAAMSKQVFVNNHWDLLQNIRSASGGSPSTKPTVIPAKIGDPSTIKHVFLIIRENRSYDQVLGDVTGGNGDASLAVFGVNSTYTAYPVITPNAHALVQRFPLLDNFYDPSRQSADGHNWILQAMAPYADDVQSPDWLRDYPSNGGDSIAYQNEGHLFDVAAKAGIKTKIFGEYVEYDTFNIPGCTPKKIDGITVTDSCEPSWTDFYNDTLQYESGKESQLQYYNAIGSFSPLPNVMKYAVPNYPQFDLGIPDQYRVDIWKQDFEKDVKANTVPQLSIMWISSDHTGGPPNPVAMQADNDLALGRFVDAISHSPIWSTSAIFVEEDDAQNGVDHVDGHRSPGYVISPYVNQKVTADGVGAGVTEDSTFYTQVNMTRTIEQILGLPPMNQFDLVASPMRTVFTDTPAADNFKPWTHVANAVPLYYGVSGYTPPSDISLSSITPAAARNLRLTRTARLLEAGWEKKKAEIFAGKQHTPDSEDIDTVNHLTWYEATGFVRPYPGEKRLRPASDFNRPAPRNTDPDD